MQAVVVIGIVFLGMLLSIFLRKLSTAAAITGSVLAIVIYFGSGLPGFLAMTAFFVMGTWATSWKSNKKKAAGLEHGADMRLPGQVLANAGAATACSVLYLITRDVKFILLTSCCFSSAAADTVSSELGTLYGKRFFNILTFTPAVRGNNGVVSVAGTVLGMLASCVIALIYYAFAPSLLAFGIIVLSGTIGNLADSVLGAAFENRGWMSNDVVNFLNTVIAAVFALVLL